MTDITTIIDISDLHVNSVVALAPPTVQLDKGSYRASREQRELWTCWLDFCEKADQQPGRRVLKLGGDLVELDTRRRSNELITPDKATVQRMVMDVLEPMLAVITDVIVLRGTPAHVGKGAWIEEAIAGDMTGLNVIKDDEGHLSHYHLRRSIEGVLVDMAHHAPMSGIPGKRNIAAENLAWQILYYYRIMMDTQPPRLVLRSHNHQRAHAELTEGPYTVTVDYSPAWTLKPEYIYRIGRENSVADIGGTFYRFSGGTFETEPITYRYKQPKGRLWQTL